MIRPIPANVWQFSAWLLQYRRPRNLSTAQAAHHANDLLGLGPAREVDVHKGVANDTRLIDHKGGRYRDEPPGVAVPLLEVDAQAGEKFAIAIRGAKEDTELKPNRSIDIRQDLIAQTVPPFRLGKVRAGVRRQRDEMSACSFDRRQYRLESLQRDPAIGAPISAKKINH